MPDPVEFLINDQVTRPTNFVVTVEDPSTILGSLAEAQQNEVPGILPDNEFNDDVPPIVAEQMGTNRYTDADIDGNIQWDMGLAAMPVCGVVGTPPKIIRVHPPIAYRSVEFTAGRQRQRPRIPSSHTSSVYDVALSKTIYTSTPTIDQQGNLIYRTGGRYEYVMLQPPAINDPLPVGVPPWCSSNAKDLAIQPTDFDFTLLDSQELQVTNMMTQPVVPGLVSNTILVGP